MIDAKEPSSEMTGPEELAKVLYATFEHIPAPTGTACWSAEVIKLLAQHFDLDSLSLKSEDLSHIERFHRARLLRVPLGAGSFLEGVKAFQRALNRQLDSEEYNCCQFTSICKDDRYFGSIFNHVIVGQNVSLL